MSDKPKTRAQHKSRLALWLSGIYLFFGLGSWILPLIAKPEDSLSGFFPGYHAVENSLSAVGSNEKSHTFVWLSR